MPWYLPYRVRHNFDVEQREALAKLRVDIESFKPGELFAVGNEGLIYAGHYPKNPHVSHLLKVALNTKKRSKQFSDVMDIITREELPFIYRVPEFGVWEADNDYWYQIMEQVDGITISKYLQMSASKRLAVCDPVVLCIDLLEQTRSLDELRIIAPNVDAENVLITAGKSLVRIDLDPYVHISNGKLPRYPLRRLFKLLQLVLIDYKTLWHEKIKKGEVSFEPQQLDKFFEQLRQSAMFGYDDPRKNRHKHDKDVDPAVCFRNAEQALEQINPLFEALNAALNV